MIRDTAERRGPLDPRSFTLELSASTSALRLVQADYNPRHSLREGWVKQLYAALITDMEAERAEAQAVPRPEDPMMNVPGQLAWEKAQNRARWASMAITHLETACALAVKMAAP